MNKIFSIFLIFTQLAIICSEYSNANEIIDGSIIDYISIARSIPQEIEAKGKEQFPKLNLVKLKEILGMESITEMKPIKFSLIIDPNSDGNQNDNIFLTNKDTNTVTIIPQLFNTLKQNSPELLKAFILNSVLELLDIESNERYNILSQLFGGDFQLRVLNLQIHNNQIRSSSSNSKAVIYWTQDSANRLTFFFCQNSEKPKTCAQIGKNSYTEEQINNLSDELKLNWQAKKGYLLHKEKLQQATFYKWWYSFWGTLASFTVGGAVYGSPGGFVGSAGGAIVGMIASVPAMFLLSIPATNTEDTLEQTQIILAQHNNLEHVHLAPGQLSVLKEVDNVKALALNLQRFFSYLDKASLRPAGAIKFK